MAEENKAYETGEEAILDGGEKKLRWRGRKRQTKGKKKSLEDREEKA